MTAPAHPLLHRILSATNTPLEQLDLMSRLPPQGRRRDG